MLLLTAFTDALAETDAPDTEASPIAPLSLEALSATRERPLFVPDRRPPQPPPPPPPVVEEPPTETPAAPPLVVEMTTPPSATLVGIVQGAGRGVAVFKDDGKNIILAPGDEIEGWRLVTLAARKIVLRKDDQHIELALPKPGDPTESGQSSQQDVGSDGATEGSAN
ncbi:hypothetical protein BJF93_12785 [Xaviernesmea oryzae]|uniref:Uncharacterized protein n=2 Tax=Xaviernesmea oryzae TaxID=464029 RepID=A0A1Q9AQQ7_9HYPH|nr:hypothetical protein BJF93_12785 [Xaviernesmea oryzae]